MSKRAEKTAVILIAGPSAELRRSWSKGIDSHYAIQEVAQRQDLERSMAAVQPDLLLLDLALCQPGGLADVPAIQRSSPATKILLLTGTPDEKEGIAALKMGAKGYCNRNLSPLLLRKAVETLREGQLWVKRTIIAHLLDDLLAPDRPHAGPTRVVREPREAHPPLRVLLVDDSPQFLNALAHTLSSDPQVEIAGLASSGREALERVVLLQPDVVLMDLAMPEMNGLEATREIKTRPGAPHVVIMTMYDVPAYRTAAESVGADGFILKENLDRELSPLFQKFALEPASKKAPTPSPAVSL